jgi:hypothetical protein
MARSIRFRYNPVFLPEYLSTIVISIPISALFLHTPLVGGRAAMGANPHFGIAVGLDLAIAGWLLIVTVLHRRKYGPVIVHGVDSGMGEVGLRQIAEARQSFGKFFGRLVRRIHVEDTKGEAVVLCDAIFNFDALRTFLVQLLGKDIPHFPHEEPVRTERVRVLWRERHDMFPPTETLGDMFSRLSWRAVCLLPVAVVDVLIHLGSILYLSKFQKDKLMVYSGPLSLLVSGLVARYVYYYMFSSTTMNKERGVGGRI